MTNFAKVILIGIVLLVIDSLVRAEVAFDRPLQGWQRVGQFVPIQITACQSASTLRIPGLTPLELIKPGIVPALVLESTTDSAAQMLRPDQCLIVHTTLNSLDESKLPSPWKRPTDSQTANVSVKVSLETLMTSPPLAWSTVDLFVLDAEQLALVDIERQSAWLRLGISLAIQTTSSPDSLRPWKQSGSYWVLRSPVVGPRGAICADVYLPTESWHPTPATGRGGQIMLMGVLFGIIVMGSSLWKSDWTWLAVVGLSVISAGLFWKIQHNLPGKAGINGEVLVRSGQFQQRDRWMYSTYFNPNTSEMDLTENTWPVFASSEHSALFDPKIVQSVDGSFRVKLTRPANVRLAQLARSVETDVSRPATTDKLPSPLLNLGRQAYQGPDRHVVGVIPPEKAGNWPGILIE